MRMFKYFVLFVLICFAGFAFGGNENVVDKNADKFDVIVIDPGHGGNDVGASSSNGLNEKDVTLKISKRLKALLEENMGMQVFLTREKDRYMSLKKRRIFVNEIDADLFISIHANSSNYLSISGCETYFFKKDASDEQARLIAELENKDISSDDDESDDALEFILMDMANSEVIELSYKLADIIQKNYVSEMKSPDRGVRQAPFIVLKKLKMPAVLTEIGFLSSRKDENKLKDDRYLEDIAQSIYKSVKQFKDILETKNGKSTKVTEMAN